MRYTATKINLYCKAILSCAALHAIWIMFLLLHNMLLGYNHQNQYIYANQMTELDLQLLNDGMSEVANNTNNYNQYASESSNMSKNNMPAGEDIQDPLEPYNQFMFTVNKYGDVYIFNYTSKFYNNYVPKPISILIGNFFGLFADLDSLANDVLQGKVDVFLSNFMRFSVNLVFGLLGTVDIATAIGLEKNMNSFGKTLYVYGWKNSSYFIVPIFGPSNIRDTIGASFGIVLSPSWYIDIPDLPGSLQFTIGVISAKAKYNDYMIMIYEHSIDPYIALRSYYTQAMYNQF